MSLETPMKKRVENTALKETRVNEHGFLSKLCFQLVFHWLSKLMQISEIFLICILIKQQKHVAINNFIY